MAPRTVVVFAFAGVVLGAGLLAVGYQLGLRAAGPAAGPVAAVDASAVAPVQRAAAARPVTAVSKPVPLTTRAEPPVEASKAATGDSAEAPSSDAAQPVTPAPTPTPTPSPAPDEAPPAPVEILEEAPSRGYGVQIGAYEDELEARAFIDSVAGGLGSEPVHLIAAEVADGRVWYRIRVGHYRSRRRAAAAQAKLPTELAKASMVVRYR